MATITITHEIKETKEFLKRQWSEPYGDRSQEIVFIGINQDQEKMTAMLNSILLNDEEFQLGPEVW